MTEVASGVEVVVPADDTILTREALDFVGRLHRELNPTRRELLERRHARQLELDGGALPGFRPETQRIREGVWRVAAAPADVAVRRRRSAEARIWRMNSLTCLSFKLILRTWP